VAEMLRTVATRHGLSAPPSAANFQLIAVGPVLLRQHQAGVLGQWLRDLRAGRSGLFSDYIRITTGTLAVLERFATVLDRVLTTLDRGEPRTARALGGQGALMICSLLIGRHGSVGFPGKNVYPVLGRPLMAYR